MGRTIIGTEDAYRLATKAILDGCTITATHDAKAGEWSHTWTRFPVTTTITRDSRGFTYLSVNNAVA
jgi:hypothetical protein